MPDTKQILHTSYTHKLSFEINQNCCCARCAISRAVYVYNNLASGAKLSFLCIKLNHQIEVVMFAFHTMITVAFKQVVKGAFTLFLSNWEVLVS